MKTNREAIKRDILGYVIPTYTGKCVGDINLRNSLGNLIVEKLKKDFEVIYEEGNGIYKKIVNSLTPICHSIVFKDKFVTGKIRVSTGNCGTPIGLKIKLHKNTTKRNLISHVKEYDLYEKVFYRLKGNIPEDLIELVNAEVSGVSIDTNTILYKKLVSQIVRDYPKKMELFNKKLEVVAEVIAEEFRKYSLNQKNYIKKLSTKTALMNYSSLRIQLIEDEIKMMDQNIFNFESSLNKTIVNENSDFKTWVIYFTKDYRNSDEFYIDNIYIFPFRIYIKVNGDVYFFQSGRQINMKTEKDIIGLFNIIKNIEDVDIIIKFKNYCEELYIKSFKKT